MLAKEIKIAKLKEQREFIMSELQKDLTSKANTPIGYLYAGHLFPEVISYLQSEGFEVKELSAEISFSASKGFPLHIITPRNDLVLSKEEKEMAESAVVYRNAFADSPLQNFWQTN